MSNYEEGRVKLTNIQLNKLKSAANKHPGATLRTTKENFQSEELPHELLLTIRQKAKIRNDFNNISTDITFSATQVSKLIQSEVFHRAFLRKLAGSVMDMDVVLAVKVLLPSGLVEAAFAADAVIQKNIHGRGAVATSQGRGKTFVISNEDMDIIKIIKSIEDSFLLINEISERLKNKIKVQRDGFLGMLLETSGASMLGNMLAGKRSNESRPRNC